jgi:MFS family permease
MPVVALARSFAVFVVGRSVMNFALNGEWSLGYLLVAETWPARLRGRVVSINRATWCFGVSLAGVISGIAAAFWGWRVAVMLPAVIALLAIYVRATCPESPYWVRAQDGERRIAGRLSAGRAVNEDDRACYAKARRCDSRQVFMRDVLPTTLVALFLACSSCCIFGTVGAWMRLFVDREALVDARIQRLLRVVGHRRLLRPVAPGLAGRRGRPPHRLHHNADRGRHFYDPMGSYRQPHTVVGIRSGLEIQAPWLLGTERDLDRRGVSKRHPRRRQRRGVGDRLVGASHCQES